LRKFTGLNKYCDELWTDFCKSFRHCQILKLTINFSAKDTYFKWCNSWYMPCHYTKFTLYSLKYHNLAVFFMKDRAVRSNYIYCNCCHVLTSRFRLPHLVDVLFQVHLRYCLRDGMRLLERGHIYLLRFL